MPFLGLEHFLNSSIGRLSAIGHPSKQERLPFIPSAYIPSRLLRPTTRCCFQRPHRRHVNQNPFARCLRWQYTIRFVILLPPNSGSSADLSHPQVYPKSRSASCSAAQDRFLTFVWFTTETPADLRVLALQNTQTQVREATRCDATRRFCARPPIHGLLPRLDRLTNRWCPQTRPPQQSAT